MFRKVYQHVREAPWAYSIITGIAVLSIAIPAGAAITANTPKAGPAHTTGMPIAATAKVLKVTVWGFGLPDPQVKGEKVDVYSVKLKNVSNPKMVLEQAAVTLTARSHGQPDVIETILIGSEGGYAGSKPIPTWVLPLKPGTTKTVFFVTRSGTADQYCAGGTILKPSKCSPRT